MYNMAIYAESAQYALYIMYIRKIKHCNKLYRTPLYSKKSYGLFHRHLRPKAIA